MRIGLIDVDGHNYPNLPLMKVSAWHKSKGDSVEWYNPLISGHMDKVYMSKVFSFTDDYPYYVDADEVVRGGTGYAISMVDGREKYDKSKDNNLPYEIEHIYPDYSLYPEKTKDCAYGFLTRGCARGCSFCIVNSKEGCSHKVADLSEFWNGQKHIELLDPNLLASPDSIDLLNQLIESKARVNFNQGLDIRMMTEEKAELLSRIKLDAIHFAWDRYEDKDIVQPKFLEFRKHSKVNPHNLQVYCLCGDKSKELLPQDIERVMWLRQIGYAPYVMLFEKYTLKKGCDLLKFQRWVNNRFIFWKTESFDDYLKENK